MNKLPLFLYLSILLWLCSCNADSNNAQTETQSAMTAQDTAEAMPVKLIHAEDVQTLSIGSTAPDFTLPGVDGKDHSLHDYDEAKVLAIIFTCNHCPTAQAYEERMIRLTKDYQDKGVRVVAVSPNDPLAIQLDELGYTDMSDTFEEMKIRAKEKNYPYPYLYDGATQAMSAEYGPIATPHVFLFDRDRKLQYSGRLDGSEKPGTGHAEDVRAALDAMLAGKKVPTPTTKTFGCSVKWSGKRDNAEQARKRWAAEEASVEMIDTDGIQELTKNNSSNLRLINVWATWCGPCVTEFPDFVDMGRMYGNREFELITISADKPEVKDKVLGFLNKKDAAVSTNYLFAKDDKYALIEAIDPEWQGALPYTLLIKPGGEKIYARQGTIDPQEMKRLITEQLGRYY